MKSRTIYLVSNKKASMGQAPTKKFPLGLRQCLGSWRETRYIIDAHDPFSITFHEKHAPLSLS